MLDEVHLERTADTAVLQRDKRVVLLRDYSTLLDQLGIDIDFADIIHDNGKSNPLFVQEDSIQ